MLLDEDTGVYLANCRDNEDDTPLHFAAQRGYVRLVDVRLKGILLPNTGLFSPTASLEPKGKIRRAERRRKNSSSSGVRRRTSRVRAETI